MKLERFGDRQKGLYFALRNSGGAAAAAEVLLDAKALDLRDFAFHVQELVEKRAITRKAAGDAVSLSLRIEAGETLLLAISPAPGRTDRRGKTGKRLGEDATAQCP